MSKRGGWGPMAQRVQNGGESTAPAGEPRPPRTSEAAEASAGSRVKHCWVTDGHGRLPGLLLEWARTASGYRGRVVRPVLDEELGWIVVEEWLSADLLESAESR